MHIKDNMHQSSNCKKGKVYLLRHEKRGREVSFETELLPEGLENAEKVVASHLEQLSIGTIYSSPFIRTLQTIKPYCDKTGKKVNLEWSLVESFPTDPKIPPSLNSIINYNYISFAPYLPPKFTNILEFDLLKRRVKSFIDSLDRSENILLVTHMPVINAVLSSRGFELITMYTPHEPGSILSMSGDLNICFNEN